MSSRGASSPSSGRCWSPTSPSSSRAPSRASPPPSRFRAVSTPATSSLAAVTRWLVTSSRAVGVMGLIYLPFLTSDALRGWLIETVAVQTQWGINLLGYSPELMTSESGYESLFVFRRHGLVNATEIVLMCTGLGASPSSVVSS
ncbi:archaeosortase A, partial [Halomarina oriensis]|nr:archaeosortase A [Halomarina oriensis]